MNKNVILLSAAVALLFSCVKESVVNEIQPGEIITFTAEWADGDPTRTVLQSDGTSVWWTPGEEINAFYGNKFSGKFSSTNTSNQALASFQGTLTVLTGTAESGNEAASYWAVYPYDAGNTCDGQNVTLTVPSEQTATAGSFADKLFPAVATSKSLDLAFYNVCGGVRFSVSQVGIISVTFKANDSKAIAGKVKVGFGADGYPVVKNVLDGKSEVKVTAPSGEFVPGKYYFAALLPGTLSKGLSMTFETLFHRATYMTESSITVNRSRFGKLDEKDNDLTFEPKLLIPEAVDLGLSVKWASFNLGASKPEDYGDYYAWGELEPKDAYTYATYKWCMGEWNAMTKYCNNSELGYNGFTDNKTVLDLEDDAAHVNFSGSWRMPTDPEWIELRENCTWTWTTQNGVNGRLVTASNGNSIFLPVGGFVTSFDDVGSDGYYWSSSLETSSPGMARLMFFDSVEVAKYLYSCSRAVGCLVRPVYAE